VNAGVVRERLGIEADELIHNRMKNRIRRVLKAAVKHNIRNLVLGEFGCGALDNNPRDVILYMTSQHINSYVLICVVRFLQGCSLFQGRTGVSRRSIRWCV